MIGTARDKRDQERECVCCLARVACLCDLLNECSPVVRTLPLEGPRTEGRVGRERGGFVGEPAGPDLLGCLVVKTVVIVPKRVGLSVNLPRVLSGTHHL